MNILAFLCVQLCVLAFNMEKRDHESPNFDRVEVPHLLYAAFKIGLNKCR